MNLLPLLQELQATPTACYDFARLLKENPDLANSHLHWGVLTTAALVDSINPCAIAVLLILLGGLIQSVAPPTPTNEQAHPEQPGANTSRSSSQVLQGDQPEDSGKTAKETDNKSLVEDEEVVSSSVGAEDEDLAAANNSLDDAQHGEDAQNTEAEGRSRRRHAFLSGMAFISSVFISYYTLGFGVFTVISSTKVSGQILLALGIFIIFLGIWNFKDYFCYGIGYNVEIPRSWRPLLKRLLGAITSPLGAFAAGFLVCLFELPCTGGPYLFILGLLATRIHEPKRLFCSCTTTSSLCFLSSLSTVWCFGERQC